MIEASQNNDDENVRSSANYPVLSLMIPVNSYNSLYLSPSTQSSGSNCSFENRLDDAWWNNVVEYETVLKEDEGEEEFSVSPYLDSPRAVAPPNTPVLFDEMLDRSGHNIGLSGIEIIFSYC
ncbi:MAG: hypothetical protein WBJ81_04470 [Rickettsiales bacterium]